MRVGAQLYTVRELCQDEAGLAATLEQIAKIGYTAVQVSAIGPLEPEIVRGLCDRYQLRIVLTHTDPQEILSNTEKVIADHQILGADYVGIGSLPKNYSRDPDGMRRFWADYQAAAVRLAAAGIPLQYHNHHFELERFSGRTLLDLLADMAAPDQLGFIIDTYWLQYAGADAAEIIRALTGRVPVVHLKDMAVSDGKQVMAAVLSGNMNFQAILDACAESGTKWLMIEQDTCPGSPLESLAESYHNLHDLGFS